MIKYFRKRKNFNLIKKLIKTKEIEKITGINGFPLRTVYLIDNTIYIYRDDHPHENCWEYDIFQDGKEVYLDFWDYWRLFELAEEQYRFNNSV